ncbi:MAG: SgcJ/EcaC family oxidoreductase [Acidobacteria bacterium]|nr:SgcJ/EcaC family oxidoreductase [Acidobacteriota bacterium]
MPAQHPAQVHKLFREAFNSGSVDAVLALYEDQASFVTGPGASVTGKIAIREALLGFLAMRPSVRLETISVVEGGGDLAFLESRWVVDGTGPDGKPVQMTGTSREVVRRQKDGTWLYAIDDPGVGR